MANFKREGLGDGAEGGAYTEVGAREQLQLQSCLLNSTPVPRHMHPHQTHAHLTIINLKES